MDWPRAFLLHGASNVPIFLVPVLIRNFPVT